MSSRNRGPRANHNQDADEEHRLWSQIRTDAKKIDTMVAKSASIGNEIVEIEETQAALVKADKPSDAGLDERLEVLYRENIRLSEQIAHIIEGNSGDTNLLEIINVLRALREASEASEPPPSRRDHSASSKARANPPAPKRKGPGSSSAAAAPPPPPPPPDDNENEDSAAPSPRQGNGSSRLSAPDSAGSGPRKPARGSSTQPPTREVSVKIEDGDSVTSSVEGHKQSTPGSSTSRLTLSLGAMVFYRNKGRAAEGEGILCRVTNVIGEGKQRRYEIQDADPDPAPAGEMPAPYRASVSHLVPIPMSNVGLPDLHKGKHVLAQYPDTTTFYKAEVSTAWRAKDLGSERGTVVRLRFEGEMEETKETEVERKFVLVEK